MGDRAGRDVDDDLVVPEDDQPAGLGDLAEDGGLDVPLGRDLQERLEVGGADDRHHPLLRLAHEDLLGPQAGVAQRHPVEVDHHAAVAVAGELAGRAGQAGAAEVLDAVDDAGGEQVQAALDQDLLGERVADLDGGALGGAALVEGLAREHRDAADAVAAGARAEEDDQVALAAGVRQVDLVVLHRPDAERVDQRVALVAGVEEHLAADVGQAEAVAVAADAGDDARAAPDACRGGPGRRTAASPSPRSGGRPSP